MIQMFHVSKTYAGGIEALKDINLKIEEKEFVFLSGPSGAGKTTIIKLLLMIEELSQGEILLFNRNLKAIRRSSIPYIRRNIGAVFQDFKLLPKRSVFENVSLSLEIHGVQGGKIKRRVDEVLESVGLYQLKNAYPPMLSGGEQQRVAIARALAARPLLLLADEPTGNLDPDLSFEIIKLFEEINKMGTTILIATHDKLLLETFKKRVILLNKGFLIEDKILQD